MYIIRGICTVLYVCIVSEVYVLYCTVCMYIIRGICTVLYVCIVSEEYVLYCTVCMYIIRGSVSFRIWAKGGQNGNM